VRPRATAASAWHSAAKSGRGDGRGGHHGARRWTQNETVSGPSGLPTGVGSRSLYPFRPIAFSLTPV